MDNDLFTPALGGDEPMATPEADARGYENRPYERRLAQNGRRFISVDVDAHLLENIDRKRGKLRRGAYLDRLLTEIFASEGDLRMSG